MCLTGVNVLPIFNQDTGMVWNDFANICAKCMRVTYPEIDYGKKEILNDVLDLQESWDSGKNCFAFGAYNTDKKMVGFLSGFVDDTTTKVERLYVLPEYQKKHIGSRLLKQAEQATSLNAKYLEIRNLSSNSEGFFLQKGYTQFTSTMCKKLLTPVKCEVVPVFVSNPSMIGQLRKIIKYIGGTKDPKSVSYKIKEMISVKTPFVIWVNQDSKITEAGIKLDKSNINIYASPCSAPYNFMLKTLSMVR